MAGGSKVRSPDASSVTTRSSVLDDLNVPKPGTAMESRSAPASRITTQRPSTSVDTSAGSRLSRLDSRVIKVLLSNFMSDKMWRISVRQPHVSCKKNRLAKLQNNRVCAAGECRSASVRELISADWKSDIRMERGE